MDTQIRIVDKSITLNELKAIAKERFGDMVKGVVDLEKKIMAMGGELHADEEALLLEQGSKQSNLWGFNIYVDQSRDSWIEFDSMINIRPTQGNRSRTIESTEIQKQIIDVTKALII